MLNNLTDYAQVGRLEYAYGTRDTFVEFNDPGVTQWMNLFSPYGINSDPLYEVKYDPACSGGNCFLFYSNGTYLTYSAKNWTPTIGESNAEIHTEASQVPGGTSNKTFPTSLRIWTPAGTGGSWHTMAGTVATIDGGTTRGGSGPAPSWVNVSNPSGGTYDAWDSACSN